jgi:hypothetical protein
MLKVPDRLDRRRHFMIRRDEGALVAAHWFYCSVCHGCRGLCDQNTGRSPFRTAPPFIDALTGKPALQNRSSKRIRRSNPAYVHISITALSSCGGGVRKADSSLRITIHAIQLGIGSDLEARRRGLPRPNRTLLPSVEVFCNGPEFKIVKQSF